MADDNVKTVQDIYGAFGRGEIPAILARCTEDTEWGYNGARSDVPWHRPIKGRAELPKFFEAMGGSMDFHDFRPLHFVHSGADVICHVALEFTVKQTGRRVKEEQLHWWTFEHGQVRRLLHFEDTAQVAAAVAR
jgi:ketosteroid isomerase-like protein